MFINAVSTVFQLYRRPVLFCSSFSQYRHNIFPRPLAASYITIVEEMDSGEIGMKTVAMTIINPREEYWQSRRSKQRPPVFKSCTLPTELWGSACILRSAENNVSCGQEKYTYLKMSELPYVNVYM